MNRFGKAIGWTALLAVATTLGACASTPSKSGYSTPSQLNAAKVQFNEQRVKVRGWMRVGFENYALWQSESANRRGSFAKDCVSLMIPESSDLERFDKHYVEIEGVFMARLPKNVVHLGGCNSTTLQVDASATPVVVKQG
jgi:hypothetical protein